MMKTKQLTASELIQATRNELIKARYTKLSMREPERVWRNLDVYLRSKGLVYYSSDIGMSFLKEQYNLSLPPTSELNKDRLRAIQMLTDFQLHERIMLRRRSKQREFAQPFRMHFQGFMDFRKNAGISPRTLDSYAIYLDRFSHYLADQAVNHVSEIDMSHIHGFIQTTAASHQTPTVYCTSCLLRVLFRYLYEQKLIPKNLALFVPSVKCNKKSKIPSAYSHEEIQSMLSCIDRGSPKGKRDYAMLLIAVRLGLRASDICGLTFDNFKWETNTIELIQGKTNEPIILPLFNDVGKAVIDYIKYGRPAVRDMEVFLRLTTPVGRLTASTLHSIVTEYMNKAGINIPEGKKHGPHALRHSLASALLNSSTPMPVISEILGHSDTETTSVYLKIDILHLRDYSLDVPPAQVVLMGGIMA